MSEKDLLTKSTTDDMNEVMRLVQNFSDSFCYTIDFTTGEGWFNGGAEKYFEMPGACFEHSMDVIMGLCYEEDRPALKADLEACESGAKNDHFIVYRWYNREHKVEWIECRGYCLNMGNGHRIMIGRVREIGHKQKADNITGLQKEVRFQQKIQPILENEPNRIRYCIRFGIDNFKEINEKDGMTAGDEILKEVADFIVQAVENKVTVYRMVADEFLIMVMVDSGVPSPRTVYDRVTRKIASTIRKRDYSRFYTISAGTLEKNYTGMTFEEVMHNTEFAMFQAKRNGRNQMVFFDQSEYNKYLSSLHIREIMQKAIKDDFRGFDVFFQPIVVSRSDGFRLEGAEALLRWHDEEGNYISPAVMIPILEESSMIIPVGKFVLRRAAMVCSEWRKYIPDFRVNVNLSYVQMRQSDVSKEISKALNEFNLPPDGLVVEVTESGYIQTDVRCRILFNMFREKNIDVAIDDFGTGYSNLRYIRDMNAQIVKLDRSFVIQALEDTYDFTVLSNIIKMVHEVGMRVCVEGIEKQEELDKIGTTEPDMIQGFFFGRPVCTDDFEKLYLTKAV
jgi:diguanylate cyclase (GGDEF)-like protein